MSKNDAVWKDKKGQGWTYGSSKGREKATTTIQAEQNFISGAVVKIDEDGKSQKSEK